MKNLKLLLVVFVMIISSAIKAGTVISHAKPDSVSVEIERLLAEINSAENNNLEVTVFFSVSEDQKIQSLSVVASDKEVGNYIYKQLENKLLPAENWMKGKIYELTVVRK